MKQININKYLIGKKKLGKGMRGAKGEVAVPTGAFGNGSKHNKRKK
tara:strand:- start:10747 stop:10884 length:138 start_codon:yes stop_codon:yes gene_type:complete